MAELREPSLSSSTQARFSNVDLELLVAQLADEAEHWKSQAEAFEAALDELRAELDRLFGQAEIAEAWRQGLSSELVALAHSSEDHASAPPSRSLALVLPVALLLWALLGLVAYGGYRLFTG